MESDDTGWLSDAICSFAPRPSGSHRLRGDFHVIDGRVWFGNLLAHFTQSLEVGAQGILKVPARVFLRVGCLKCRWLPMGIRPIVRHRARAGARDKPQFLWWIPGAGEGLFFNQRSYSCSFVFIRGPNSWSFVSPRDPQAFGEGPLGIDPLRPGAEAGALRDAFQFLELEFVAGFGPDGLAFLESRRDAGAGDRDGLVARGDKVHFDAVAALVVAGLVGELAEREVAGQLAVDARGQVEVERRGHPRGIVVGGDQAGGRLHQVRAQEQAVAGRERGADRAQEVLAGAALEVADGAA